MEQTKKEKISQFIIDNPTLTDSQVASELAVSRSYVTRVREQLHGPKPKIITQVEYVTKHLTPSYMKVAFVVMLALLCTFMKNCSDKDREIFSLSNLAKQNKIESEKWIDLYNKEHIRVQQIELSKEDLRREVERVSYLLSIKPKQIHTVTTSTSSLKFDTIVKVDTFTRDGVQIREFKWSDNYISVSAQLAEESGDIQVSGFDTLTYTEYWKRKNIFSRKNYFVDLSNSNPYIKFSSIKSLTLDKTKPKFIIGPSFGVGYTLKGIQPLVGVSVIYYPISLKFY